MSSVSSADSARAVEIYDLRGLNCPLPVLKTRKRLSGMSPGGRLWIEATDPLSSIDIPAMLNDDGHRLVATEQNGSVRRFLIERG